MILVPPRPGFVNNDQPAQAWIMDHVITVWIQLPLGSW